MYCSVRRRSLCTKWRRLAALPPAEDLGIGRQDDRYSMIDRVASTRTPRTFAGIAPGTGDAPTTSCRIGRAVIQASGGRHTVRKCPTALSAMLAMKRSEGGLDSDRGPDGDDRDLARGIMTAPAATFTSSGQNGEAIPAEHRHDRVAAASRIAKPAARRDNDGGTHVGWRKGGRWRHGRPLKGSSVRLFALIQRARSSEWFRGSAREEMADGMARTVRRSPLRQSRAVRRPAIHCRGRFLGPQPATADAYVAAPRAVPCEIDVGAARTPRRWRDRSGR